MINDNDIYEAFSINKIGQNDVEVWKNNKIEIQSYFDKIENAEIKCRKKIFLEMWLILTVCIVGGIVGLIVYFVFVFEIFLYGSILSIFISILIFLIIASTIIIFVCILFLKTGNEKYEIIKYYRLSKHSFWIFFFQKSILNL